MDVYIPSGGDDRWLEVYSKTKWRPTSTAVLNCSFCAYVYEYIKNKQMKNWKRAFCKISKIKKKTMQLELWLLLVYNTITSNEHILPFHKAIWCVLYLHRKPWSWGWWGEGLWGGSTCQTSHSQKKTCRGTMFLQQLYCLLHLNVAKFVLILHTLQNKVMVDIGYGKHKMNKRMNY